MTPTTVGFVLVDGQGANGDTMDHDAFSLPNDSGSATAGTSAYVADAVSRKQAIAAARGHRVRSIGVTWSGDTDAEAARLLESLTDSGFDNVVAVRLPEATEALAWGIGRVIGYDKTAVCVIEPEAVTVVVVDISDNTVQATVSHALASDDDLIWWLTSTFDREDWRPEGLVLVGSDCDLEALRFELEEALSMPVLAPAEAELALARGAALASAHNSEFVSMELSQEPGQESGTDADQGRSRSWLYTGALTMLVAGVLTFVVSSSLAVGLHLTSQDSRPVENRAVTNSSRTPAAVQPAPVPLAPPVQEVQPPVQEVQPPEPAASLVPETPVEPPVTVEDSTPSPVSLPDQSAASPPPAVAPTPAPPIAPPPVAQVPQSKPGILTRIKERLSDLRGPEQVPDQIPPPSP